MHIIISFLFEQSSPTSGLNVKNKFKQLFLFLFLQKDNAGPSNWDKHPMESNNIDSYSDDQSHNYMDADSFLAFIPNRNDSQSHFANLTGTLYLLMLAEEERPRQHIHTCSFT